MNFFITRLLARLRQAENVSLRKLGGGNHEKPPVTPHSGIIKPEDHKLLANKQNRSDGESDMMTMKRASTVALASCLFFGGAAMAAKNAGPEYSYAKVTQVTPVTRIIETSRPERECWQEEVVHPTRNEANMGGLILGGVIGGVVGNRFGGGNGKKAATVAGTIAGAALGQGMGDHRAGGYSTSYQDRCRTYRSTYTEERVVGYDVRYRYNGREYVTRTDHDPGSHIKLRIDVTPVP
jgi:uncharacterized protein YcfJ